MWFSGTKTESKTHCAVIFLLRDSLMRVETVRKERKKTKEELLSDKIVGSGNGSGGGIGDGVTLHQEPQPNP